MRFLFIFAALALAAPQGATAHSACPSGQFEVAFEPHSARLTDAGRNAIAASHNRMRQCTVLGVTIFVSGDDLIGRERAQLVRSEFTSHGVSGDAPINIAIDEPSIGAESPPDRVIVMIDYN